MDISIINIFPKKKEEKKDTLFHSFMWNRLSNEMMKSNDHDC